MKPENEVEAKQIFSYAVNLEESGIQKNMIFCWEDIVYILNSDKTIVLRFETSKKLFPEPVGFFADDFDSSDFRTVGGFMQFFSRGAGWIKEKKCRVPNQTFQDVEDTFYKFEVEPSKFAGRVNLHKSILDMLDPSLSHVEFLSKSKSLRIIQRDIYSGSVSELRREDPSILKLDTHGDTIREDFGPLAMRTNDLIAVFGFNDQIYLNFLPNSFGYFFVEGPQRSMTGVVAGCLYDELGTINDLQENKEESDGRKEQEDRSSEQTTDRDAKKKVLLCRRRK
jgi:hypothetical protein